MRWLLLRGLVREQRHWLDFPATFAAAVRSPDDIEDYAAEIPPEMGTLLLFRCTPNATPPATMFFAPWASRVPKCCWARSMDRSSSRRSNGPPKRV